MTERTNATWAVIYELVGPDAHLVVMTGFKTSHDAKRWGERELPRGSEFEVKLTRIETIAGADKP